MKTCIYVCGYMHIFIAKYIYVMISLCHCQEFHRDITKRYVYKYIYVCIYIHIYVCIYVYVDVIE
jgi:hypothetical protein